MENIKSNLNENIKKIKEINQVKLSDKDLEYYANEIVEHLTKNDKRKTAKGSKYIRFLDSIRVVLEATLKLNKEVKFNEISKFIKEKFNNDINPKTIRNYYINNLGYEPNKHETKKENIQENIVENKKEINKSKKDSKVASVSNVTKSNTKSKAKTNTKKEVEVKETKIEDSISAPKRKGRKKSNS